jgi:hypothetical protein
MAIMSSIMIDNSDCQAAVRAAVKIRESLSPERRRAFEADIRKVCADDQAVEVDYQGEGFVAYASSAFLDVLRAYSGNPVI